MAVAETALIRKREKRFYLVASILFALTVLVGFGRTYYLKAFTGAPPLGSYLVEIHGAIMTAWVLFFIIQIYLVRSKNIKLHQRLGFVGVGLGALILVVGFFTAIAAAKNGPGSIPTPAGISRMSFLAVPMFDLVMFLILFGAAIYYRKKAANHKRLMLLTAINFSAAAIARFPIPGLLDLGPPVFFGIPTVLMVFAVVYDRVQNGKFNKVFVYASLLLFISYPLRLVVSGTDTWVAFAYWLTTFSII